MKNYFTRGGQLSMHRLRMLQQMARVILAVFLFATSAMLVGKTYYDIPKYQFYLLKEYYHAQFLLGFASTPADIRKAQQVIIHPNGRKSTEYSYNIAHSDYIQQCVTYIKYRLWRNFILGLWTGGALSLLIMGAFIYRGWRQIRTKTERGTSLVSTDQLKRRIRRRYKSDLYLDGLPLIKGAETSHFVAAGTTGSGKSNLFHTLLPQIRTRGDRAIIVDLTGDFISRYYDCCSDFLLNPFDMRHQNWSPWQECQAEPHYVALAHAMIPEKGQTQDPFWENASRIVLATALRKFAEEKTPSTQELYRLLVEAPMTEYQKFFEGTEAVSLTDKQADKTAASIRSNLSTQLVGLKYLSAQEDTPGDPFSIRNWVRHGDPGSWLFLSAFPGQRQSLQGLMTAWMDTAISALMTLEPNYDRRLWFVMDELPALNRLPSLEMMLAESRKYGGCVLAGFQSMPQLTTVYGASIAQTLLGLFNTQAFFCSTNPDTTSWISKVLGEAEIQEVKESLSYGAQAARDGVSLSQQHRRRSVVLPTQISSLKSLQCYVKLPGDYPVTQLQMSYKKGQIVAPGFLARPVALSKISPKKMEEKRELVKDEKTAESKDEGKLERNLV
ncbi:MAG: type IV conjugative transfer system coupling protein TraD [Pseudomonadota bacterium]